jgi:ribosomal protein RSM22 (predicted rRNA methylase)
LNPKGGILILLEKGVPRGFEAVAGARDLLLNKHISSPGSTTFEVNIADPRSVDGRYATKEEGMIIAPCTNHVTCPLYKTAGLARGRKDWCHFTQRYIRPTFLQHVLGAKSRNHDDVEFSYLAVRRGVDLRKSEPAVVQGKKATDEAFEGYGERRNRTILDEADEEEALQDHESALDIFAEREHEIALAAPASIIPDPVLPALTTATAAAPNTAKSPPHTLTLPRTILEPVKRKGHVLVDVCTPAGSYERWMVKRKCGTQAYRDARKARWGDLWALGAWSRSPRRINVGVVVGAGGRRGAGGRGRKGARERGRKQDDDAEDEDE